MNVARRKFLAAGAMCGVLSRTSNALAAGDQGAMFGLIGKMTTVPGKREDLIAILIEGVAGMPGCLSYIVARDAGEADAIWVTEVWDSQASHDASLSLPAVKAAIAKGRPLIAGFSNAVTTTPVGGHGLTTGR